MSIEDDWTLFRMQGMKPERFEELCCALLGAQGHTDVRHWGAAGSEGGVDILSLDADGRRWVTQCKRTANFSASKAEPELQKVLSKPPSPPPDFYRLAAPCNISRKTEETLEELAEESRTCTGLQIAGSWTATALVGFLRDDYPDLREKFIGKVGPLPFWNVPRGTDFFTGREEILEELERRLEAGSASLTQTIVGLGGIGKTQIAIEYCRQHRARYRGGIFWLDASSADSLRRSYAQCAEELDLVQPKTPEEDAIPRFLRHLASHSDWLTIFDNADEPEEIVPLLPKSPLGHLLVTSRRQSPGLGRAKPLAVDCLSTEKATEFLIDRSHRKPSALSPEDQSAFQELAVELGGLPLALEQAGVYLDHHSKLTITGYLAAFRKQKATTLEKLLPFQGGYEQTVATTWVIGFEKLTQAEPAAIEALQYFAFLAPEEIPLRLLLEQGASFGPALGALVEMISADPLALEERLIEPLMRYSFAAFDGKTFSVNRLVQEIIRLDLGERGIAILGKVYEALDVLFPQDTESRDAWELAAPLLPHLQASANHWREPNGVEPIFLWLRGGSNAKAYGRAKLAQGLEEKALEVSRRVLGEEHPLALISMIHLAETLRALGDFAGARDLQENALEVYRRVRGEEHPMTLISMIDLASTLRALGDAAKARYLHENALEVRRRVLGEEHPDTLTSMNNLALNLLILGDAVGAREILENALEVSRRVLGEEHPSTLTSMNNLASNLLILGDAVGAREILENALEVRRRVLGEEHPDTLTSMSNLASTLRALGDAAKARYLRENTLEVRRRVLGEEHPSTLISMDNLAETLRAMGDSEGARDLHENSLEVRRRVLGEEHPDTLTSMNNLAETLRAIGDSTKARYLHENALEVRRRVLGEEHPSTLISMDNLAETLRAMGDSEGARDLHENALEVRRRVLGEEHPDTLTSMNNLAETLRAIGDSTKARYLHENALEVRRRVLGEKHPDTLTSMNNLASTLSDLGDSEGARDIHENALEVRRRVLGEEHPDTLISMIYLASTLRALGDAEGARDLHENALEVSRRVLREEHLLTLTSILGLGTIAIDQNELSSAEEHLRAAHSGFLKIYGPDHPHTQATAKELQALLQQADGNPQKTPKSPPTPQKPGSNSDP